VEKDIMLVYEAVKEKLGTEYANIFYQTMREEQSGDVGIYLYESSNDTEDISGNEVFNCVKVHIQVNAEQSADGMAKALRFLSSFTERIENENSNVEGIEFISAEHIGPRAIPIGKNKYNILVCRATVDLKYTFETNLIRF
jgi:hypothetical protein